MVGVDNPFKNEPKTAVAGLSDVLLALGDELRKANRKVGDYPVYADGQKPQPILFLQSATVELAINVSANAAGGVNVWVVKADTGGSYERSGKISVQLSTGEVPPGVGA